MEIFNCLTPKEKESTKVISLKKNEVLFAENDECNEIGIVLSGTISISSYSYNGKEMIFNLLSKDEMFGNNLVFSSKPFYKGNVIAKENSKVVIITKSLLINLLKTNESFLVEFLKYESDLGKKLNSKIKLLSFVSVEERFLYYLYINKEKITYTSITSLADFLSVSREALSREITKLERANKIKRKNKTIELLTK